MTGATILALPAWHQELARARLLVRRIVAAALADPRPPRQPGGMFAPPQEDDAA